MHLPNAPAIRDRVAGNAAVVEGRACKRAPAGLNPRHRSQTANGPPACRRFDRACADLVKRGR
jgi:hypothetical protein